ncbi:MAG TPA: ribokinase, partial [Pelagibacterium sp.]|nr:ribokinase [Pelagibacterium sp.]
MTVTVFGSINLDTVVQVDRIARPGDTVSGRHVATGCGGKGANQAVAASRAAVGNLGVRLIASVGDDAQTALLTSLLASEDLQADLVEVAGTPSGTAFITVDKQGENAITVVPGANLDLTASRIDGDPGTLLCQGEVPYAESIRAASVRPRSGVAIINLAPVPQTADFVDQAFQSFDIVVVNQHEASEIEALAEDTVENLAHRTSTDVVVTLGRDGALVIDRNGQSERISSPTIAPVDTTGAGDTFCGYLAAVLSEGSDLTAAATLACRAAAYACLGQG